jgi:light-regulated signal transduction histidine kinase (bacteriophytochrome)
MYGSLIPGDNYSPTALVLLHCEASEIHRPENVSIHGLLLTISEVQLPIISQLCILYGKIR